jgi:hypothetical protein
MNKKIEELIIDGEVYVPKSLIVNQKAESLDGMEYCIIRTYSAGVFAGYIAKEEGQEVIIKKARRLWKWSGAASLSQLAMEGVKNPDECKFPCEVDEVRLKRVIEICVCTQKAKDSIDSVKIWKA